MQLSILGQAKNCGTANQSFLNCGQFLAQLLVKQAANDAQGRHGRLREDPYNNPQTSPIHTVIMVPIFIHSPTPP